MERSFLGKTYSLYSDSNTTDDYFKTIKKLTDLCLQKYARNDENKLLSILQKASKNQNPFKKLLGKDADKTFSESIKKELKTSFPIYTKGVKDHLKNLSFFKRFDSTLRTTEEQYHLYMLEIELVNRIYNNPEGCPTIHFYLIFWANTRFAPTLCCAHWPA